MVLLRASARPSRAAGRQDQQPALPRQPGPAARRTRAHAGGVAVREEQHPPLLDPRLQLRTARAAAHPAAVPARTRDQDHRRGTHDPPYPHVTRYSGRPQPQAGPPTTPPRTSATQSSRWWRRRAAPCLSSWRRPRSTPSASRCAPRASPPCLPVTTWCRITAAQHLRLVPAGLLLRRVRCQEGRRIHGRAEHLQCRRGVFGPPRPRRSRNQAGAFFLTAGAHAKVQLRPA